MVALNVGLHFLQFLILQVLDDVASGVARSNCCARWRGKGRTTTRPSEAGDAGKRESTFNRFFIALAAVAALSATNAHSKQCPPFAIDADPWPKADERRSDEGTSYCQEFNLLRAFVAAPGGFAEGELLAARDMMWRGPRPSKSPRGYFFIGRKNGFIYGYNVQPSESLVGFDIKAWVVRAKEDGAGSDLLFPPLRLEMDHYYGDTSQTCAH